MFPVYCVVDAAMTFICCVGAITAFYAAVVACAQIDIKRILAFSTISQIAFMMVSLGVAYDKPIEGVHYSGLGYMAGMFHLFTHAMFKALLFLGVRCADSCRTLQQLYGYGRSSQIYADHPLDIPYRLSRYCLVSGTLPDSSQKMRCLQQCLLATGSGAHG